MGFSRQEYWSGLPFPSPGDLPDPGHRGGEERKGSWDGGTYLRCERPGGSHPRPSYSRRAASGVDTASAAADGGGRGKPASCFPARLFSSSNLEPQRAPMPLPQPLLSPPSGTPSLTPAPCLSLRPQAWRRPGRAAVGRADPSWRLSSLPPSLSCPRGQPPERLAGGSPTLGPAVKARGFFSSHIRNP